MTKRDTRAMGCMCAGYAWGGVMSGAMHRRGSLHCWFNADGSQRELEQKKVNRDIEPAELAWLDELEITPAAAQTEAIHRFAAAQAETRDRFAAAALQGMLASNGADWDIGTDKAFTARQCYEYADAMLKARAA